MESFVNRIVPATWGAYFTRSVYQLLYYKVRSQGDQLVCWITLAHKSLRMSCLYSRYLPSVVNLWEWWICWGQTQALGWELCSIAIHFSLILCNRGPSTRDVAASNLGPLPLIQKQLTLPANRVSVLTFFCANALFLILMIVAFLKVRTCQS